MMTTPIHQHKRAQLNVTVPAASDGVLPGDDWRACLVQPEAWAGLGAGRVLALDAGPLRLEAASVCCDEEGRAEVLDHWRRGPTDDDGAGLLAWCLTQVAEHASGCEAVVLLEPGPLDGFADRVGEASPVPVVSFDGARSRQACGWLFDRVVERRLGVRADVALTTAALTAERRETPTGWLFARPKEMKDLNLAPLVGLVMAVHAATYAPPPAAPKPAYAFA